MTQPASVTALTSQPPPASGSLTLSQAWTQAQRDIHSTQSPPASATPDTLVRLHSTAFHSILTLRSLLHSSALLSDNDRLSELSTSSLRYLLVPSLLAGVLLSWPGGVEGRLGRLSQCMLQWRKLIESVDMLDGLTEAEERRWKQVTAVIDADGGQDEDDSKSGGGMRLDAGQQRQEKIARFRQQREWQQQIAAYEDKQQQQQQSKKTKQGTAASAEAVDETEGDDDDDEAARAYWLLRLRVAVNAALDELLVCHQEMAFLAERQARDTDPQLRQQREREEDSRRRQSEGQKPLSYSVTSAEQLRSQPIPAHMQAYLHPLPQPAPGNSDNSSTLSAAALAAGLTMGGGGGSGGGGVVTTLDGLMSGSRSRRREDVFRVVNGPTMSVEEWADQEMAAGRLPAPQQSARVRTREECGYVGTGDRVSGAGGDADDADDDVGERGGESDERRMDGKRVEEREWDNWKDDHERGAGNRQR